MVISINGLEKFMILECTNLDSIIKSVSVLEEASILNEGIHYKLSYKIKEKVKVIIERIKVFLNKLQAKVLGWYEKILKNKVNKLTNTIRGNLNKIVEEKIEASKDTTPAYVLNLMGGDANISVTFAYYSKYNSNTVTLLKKLMMDLDTVIKKEDIGKSRKELFKSKSGVVDTTLSSKRDDPEAIVDDFIKEELNSRVVFGLLPVYINIASNKKYIEELCKFIDDECKIVSDLGIVYKGILKLLSYSEKILLNITAKFGDELEQKDYSDDELNKMTDEEEQNLTDVYWYMVSYLKMDVNAIAKLSSTFKGIYIGYLKEITMNCKVLIKACKKEKNKEFSDGLDDFEHLDFEKVKYDEIKIEK